MILAHAALTLALSYWTHPGPAQPTPPVSGTWFGSIVLTDARGKTQHDTAVLVVADPGASAGVSPKTSGSMGRTIDQMTLWDGGLVKDDKLNFHLDAAGGLDITLIEAGGHLKGSVTGKQLTGQIDLTRAQGLLPHDQLENEIKAADQKLYKAFESCDVAGFGALLSSDLEFYQDHTGKTGYAENLQALRNRCGDGIRLRRTLEEGSVIVNAAPGFGAIQAGVQQFFSIAPDGQEHLEATARFTNIWSKASGTWKLVRVVSYDHR